MARQKKPTYKELEQQLSELKQKEQILYHYAINLREGTKPSAIADYEGQKVELYRPFAAYGGYLIISQECQKHFDIIDSMTGQQWYNNMSYDLSLRIALERVLSEQKRIYREELNK
jgi:hypothetical protein